MQGLVEKLFNAEQTGTQNTKMGGTSVKSIKKNVLRLKLKTLALGIFLHHNANKQQACSVIHL